MHLEPDNFEVRVLGQHVEIPVFVQHGDVGINRDRGDEAVNKFAYCCALTAAAAINGGGLLVVTGSGRKNCRHREQASQRIQVPLVAGSREQLHADCIAGGNVAAERRIGPAAHG